MSKGGIEADRRQFLVASVGASAALLAPAPGSARAIAEKTFGLGRKQSFDADWRFHRGEGTGLELAALDDSGWRAVNLPHDWSIEDLPTGDSIVGPFDKRSAGGVATGFSIGGEGWYRKRFHLAPLPGGRAEIHFEGVYRNCDVWLNGHFLGNQPSGYMAFSHDMTPYLSASGENVIAVRVRNLGQNSRWYSGSGIYRHVWLDVLAQPARIARWGVGVTTRRISGGTASVEIATQLEAVAPGQALISRIKDGQGRVLWTDDVRAQPNQQQVATLQAPRLWSPDNPVLYALETELRSGADVIDRAVTPFGVRIVTFDAAQGMAINGAPTKLRGGCIHHDNGLLGAAAFDAAEARKVSLLKARGYNAVRPSHNPFSPAFLDACDAQGLLVICEAFDVWHAPKLPQDYALDFASRWKDDLATMVLGARNHPSIIMWSIGNEIPKRNLPEGVEAQWQLANEVHRLDPSRPVTAAINDFAGRLVTPSSATARPGRTEIADEASCVFLDAVGYNYKLDIYEQDHARFPQRIIYGSESFPKDMFAIWDLTERYFMQAIAEDPADERFAANLAKYHRSRAAALAKAQLPEPVAIAAAEPGGSRVMSAGPSQVAVGSPAAQGGYTRISRQEIEIRTATPDRVQPAADGRRRNPRYTASATYPVRLKLAPAAPVNAPTGFPVRVRLADAKAK